MGLSIEKGNDRILCGLQNVMGEKVGISPAFSAKTNFVEHLKKCRVWDEFDLADLLKIFEECFEISRDHEGWRVLFGLDLKRSEEWEEKIGASLTFGKIADFIATISSCTSIDFRSRFILGTECSRAGIFLGLKEIAEQAEPAAGTIGPSSSITRTFSPASLKRFWWQLRWQSLNRIPPLRTTIRGRIIKWFVVLMLLLGLGAAIFSQVFRYDEAYFDLFGTSLAVLMIGGAVSLGIIVLMLLISPFVKHADTGLPPQIKTFGDLARLIDPS